MPFENKYDSSGVGDTVEVSEIESLADGSIIVGDGSGAPTTLAAMTSAAGTLKHESGGLEADVSSYSGLIKINGGSTSQAVAGTDYSTPSSTDTLTNKTFDANGTGNSLSNVETADIASGSKSGSDTTLVTGTAGTSGNLASWNGDGDLVDGTISATAAVASELNTGTDTVKPVTSDALAGSNFGTRVVSLKIFDDSTAATTGDGKLHWFVPAEFNGMNLVGVSAAVSTASSSGTPEVQIHNVTSAADILSTTLTIDQDEKHSKDATAAAVIDTDEDDVATGDELRIDVDTAGTGATGLQVDLKFRLP